MSDGIIHLFSGYPDGGADVITSTITVCCKRSSLDKNLQYGTVIPNNCTCPDYWGYLACGTCGHRADEHSDGGAGYCLTLVPGDDESCDCIEFVLVGGSEPSNSGDAQ